jgi:hypothetical protein
MWIWAPVYKEENEEEYKEMNDEENDHCQTGNGSAAAAQAVVKTELFDHTHNDHNHDDAADIAAQDAEPPARYEMHVGAMIRFRVKSIQYTQVTNTAKGMQSTTTTTNVPVGGRKRSTSIGNASDDYNNNSGNSSSSLAPPPAMQIIASICEDGLGLTDWWPGGDDEAEQEEEIEVEDEIMEDIKPDISMLSAANGIR